jgi:hypothetical protein
MRLDQVAREPGERRDERASGLHSLCGQRPVRTVLARAREIAKLAADHPTHHARSRSSHKDEAKPRCGVRLDAERIGIVERAPELPDFVTTQESVAWRDGPAGSGQIGKRIDRHKLSAGLLRPFEHAVHDMLGLVRRRLLAPPLGKVGQHEGGLIVGD